MESRPGLDHFVAVTARARDCLAQGESVTRVMSVAAEAGLLHFGFEPTPQHGTAPDASYCRSRT